MAPYRSRRPRRLAPPPAPAVRTTRDADTGCSVPEDVGIRPGGRRSPAAGHTHAAPARGHTRRPLLLLGLTLAIVLLGCSRVATMTYEPPTPTAQPKAARAAPTPTARPKDRPTPTPLPRVAEAGTVVPPRSEVYVDFVQMPVGLAFAPDGRLFFSEAFKGAVRIAERSEEKARLRTEPFLELPVAKGPETGMLGIALHPEFAQNHWVYVYYSEPDPNRRNQVPGRNRVVRYTEHDNVATEPTVILDNIGINRQGRHNGGIMRFGPDGKLYVTIGNAQDRTNSQNMQSVNGKVLRLNPDGSVPTDNPFPGSPVYALGFRNPFGLTFEPGTANVWVTENSGDNNDEVNAVQPGGNYGFPKHEGFGNDPKFIDPVWSSGSRTIGPTGLVFYTGDQLPQFKGDLFFCAMNTGALTRLRLGGPDHRTVEAGEDVLTGGCFLDVINGPDGALYYSSVAQILRLGR